MTHPPGSSISVALCTYNGERFLPLQLASILRQSRLPDEVVIHDDGSTDATHQLLIDFQRTAPFPVTIHINPQNLGSTRNFEQAILACRGDLVALCDQDDIWHPDRLARSQEELAHHPEAGLVFSNADIIDDNGTPLGFTLWENFAFDRQSLEALQAGDMLPLTRRTFVTGATVVFRSRFAKICFPSGQHWLHDGWLTMLIACLATIRPIDEPLISYRFHAAQQVGLGPATANEATHTPTSLHGRLAKQAAQQAATLAYFHTILAEICDAVDRLPLTDEQRHHGTAAVFRAHRDFLAMRLALPESRMHRLPLILENAAQYQRSARGLLSMLKDLVLPQPPA